MPLNCGSTAPGGGALGFGLAAHVAGAIESAFWLVALSMFTTGAVLLAFCEENHPRLSSAS